MEYREKDLGVRACISSEGAVALHADDVAKLIETVAGMFRESTLSTFTGPEVADLLDAQASSVRVFAIGMVSR